MDPLSVTANIITVLQVANSVLSVCYEFRAAVQKAPWSLTRVLDQVKDLRNLLENVEDAVESLHEETVENSKRRRNFAILCDHESGPLIRCQQELAQLEKKVISTYGSGKPASKRRAFIQVMGWKLKYAEAKECLERIDRCKDSIMLAMTADEATMLKEIHDMNRSLDKNVKNIGADVSRLVFDIQIKERGTEPEGHSYMADITHVTLDEANKAITRWLAPIGSFDSQESVANAHHTGTGSWFLKSQMFKDWRNDDNAFMWISGFGENPVERAIWLRLT